ncbi:MAG: NAD(+) synthase [Clostridium sp.]|nr:NAD(+) synthase [Clostridium sp.]MCM1546946.1 NAD(+) synthase [Ruminococcus sp.]
MKDGFVKIACITPEIKVADCDFNGSKIIESIVKAHKCGVKICAFPELSVTGYTCGDLFLQTPLIKAAEKSFLNILYSTKLLDIVSIIGMPFAYMNCLYNCAAVIYKGQILGIVPKINIPNYSEFYELRHFTGGFLETSVIDFHGETAPFGTNQIFGCPDFPELCFGIEICEDLWAADPPSAKLAENGANIIFNLSASNEIIGKDEYRKTLIAAKSGSLPCIYAYADAGIGESTTDMVFLGHSIIAENGSILKEKYLLENDMITEDVDLYKIAEERRKINTIKNGCPDSFWYNDFPMKIEKTSLDRSFPMLPFVPKPKSDLDSRCKKILTMQSYGLSKRIKHIGIKNIVLGLSGGLDSTLALIVAVKAFEHLEIDKNGITAVTMPCFGTTDRTYGNACMLAKSYGVTLREINIKESVMKHFSDIGHDENVHDTTYENSQARERTQILMDIANQTNGIVIGTGDLSELALGWATYNGDHMSMYAVNASVPKTLVRHLVEYEAYLSDENIKKILLDILDTPVSPELLPPSENGKISQKTEDLVGPYELHDFFLYYMVRFGFSPSKIFRIAKIAFDGVYDDNTILKWEKTFYKRFFSQQFKRSCLPDGPKVGSVTLSPRGDFRMPSDACVKIWLNELDKIMEV